MTIFYIFECLLYLVVFSHVLLWYSIIFIDMVENNIHSSIYEHIFIIILYIFECLLYLVLLSHVLIDWPILQAIVSILHWYDRSHSAHATINLKCKWACYCYYSGGGGGKDPLPPKVLSEARTEFLKYSYNSITPRPGSSLLYFLTIHANYLALLSLLMNIVFILVKQSNACIFFLYKSSLGIELFRNCLANKT